LAAAGIDESSDEIDELGISGDLALEALLDKYDELIVKAKMYEAIADDTDYPDDFRRAAKDKAKKYRKQAGWVEADANAMMLDDKNGLKVEFDKRLGKTKA
jgi:hypothetical protein